MIQPQDQTPRYDIIGDIHGHADTLRELLAKLGYDDHQGAYRHPERKVAFVGDFIDRGPKIRETLQIVRAMTEAGSAHAVLGNHEWDAICFHTLGPDGRPLRDHREKHIRIHRATLDQIAEPHPDEWRDWLDWFKSLPLTLDFGGVRVVHASWNAEAIALVDGRRFEDNDFLCRASQPRSPERKAARVLLKGPEIDLPAGHVYIGRGGHHHHEIRARWFGHRNGKPLTYRELVLPYDEQAPLLPVPDEDLAALPVYGENEPPVIFGHYWLPPAEPALLAANATSVDYSVAGPHGGRLTAYRWNGEAKLSPANFVQVHRHPAP